MDIKQLQAQIEACHTEIDFIKEQDRQKDRLETMKKLKIYENKYYISKTDKSYTFYITKEMVDSWYIKISSYKFNKNGKLLSITIHTKVPVSYVKKSKEITKEEFKTQLSTQLLKSFDSIKQNLEEELS